MAIEKSEESDQAAEPDGMTSDAESLTSATRREPTKLMIEEDFDTVTRGVPEGFREKTVLVNGGAGFIGSWICESLLRVGARVVCVDSLATGTVKNIAHLKNQKGFSFAKEDICDFDLKTSYDLVVHAASIPAPEQYMKMPIETVKPNSIGLHRVLEAAARTGAKVLFTSTSEVYGDATVLPTPESYAGTLEPTGLRGSYYESKRYAEAACMAYRRELGVDVRIARIFNTYGPRIDSASSYSRVVPRFITQCLTNTPITIYGSGRRTRSFCYITDTVSGLLRMLASNKAAGEVINIGRTEETSIMELAHLIKSICHSSSRIAHLESRPDDPWRRCPDITKARKVIGWSPKVSLRSGLRRTTDWFRLTLASQSA